MVAEIMAGINLHHMGGGVVALPVRTLRRL
jgi:hypothetical protein